jgi:hypothetical protein
LINQFRLAYIYGKGKKCVPVLLPEDLIEPMKILVKHRAANKIRQSNIFIFASKCSDKHCSG